MRSFMNLQKTEIGMDPSQHPDLPSRIARSAIPGQRTPARISSNSSFRSWRICRAWNRPGRQLHCRLRETSASDAFVLEGEPEPKQLQDARMMRQLTITPGYLQTARIPLLRGRDFTAGG